MQPDERTEQVPATERRDEPVRIPKDKAARDRLANMAGLTDEERAALDEWCRQQAIEDDARRRRGLEAHGNDVMGGADRG